MLSQYDSLLLSSEKTQEKLSDSNEKFEIKPDDQQNSKETQTPDKQENMDNVQQIKQRGSGKKKKKEICSAVTGQVFPRTFE